MKEQAGELLTELIRDYKSRKWITVLGYCAVIILNKQQGWGLTTADLQLLTGAVGAYVILEGGADLIDRVKK